MFTVSKKSPQTLFEQIKHGLRGEIEAGRFKPGDAIPDENLLATQLSVSHMTVRRAIVELTRDGLLQRVSGKGTFVRNGFAPQPRSTRKGSIALLSTADFKLPASLSYYRLQQGVMLGLEQIGMPIVFRMVRESCEDTVAMLRKETSLRGVIVIWGDVPLIEALSKLSVPVINLDGVQSERQIFDEVERNAESGVYTAVDYLIHLGHRDIGFMHGDMTGLRDDPRLKGYRRALSTHGIPLRQEFIFPVIHWWDVAYAAMRGILNGPHVPTAMVCSADVMALGVMTAVTEHGLNIPKDMSVVGFGDEGYFTVPQLSTVRVPLEQMGQRAAQLLAERLEHPTRSLQRVTLETEWISRGSCACPRSK